MTVGIFGGSFNPVHNGHIILAKAIVDRKLADEVWLTVSPLNPLKENPDLLLPDNDRLEMIRLAVEGIPGLRASDIELTLPRPSYTITTLRTLSRMYPTFNFRLIIGSDNMLIFDKWKEHEEILRDYSPIIYPRPGYDCDMAMRNFPETTISSTEIRKRIKDRLPVNNLIPRRVLDYIKKYNLYSAE